MNEYITPIDINVGQVTNIDEFHEILQQTNATGMPPLSDLRWNRATKTGPEVTTFLTDMYAKCSVHHDDWLLDFATIVTRYLQYHLTTGKIILLDLQKVPHSVKFVSAKTHREIVFHCHSIRNRKQRVDGHRPQALRFTYSVDFNDPTKSLKLFDWTNATPDELESFINTII